MDASVNCRRAWRTGCRVAAVFSFMALSGLGSCYSAERGPHPSRTRGIPAVPENWVELKPSECLQVVRMLAAQTKGDYERIRTWEGKYTVCSRLYLNAAETAERVRLLPETKIEPPLVDEHHFTLEFSIDMAADVVYRWHKPEKLLWIEHESGKLLQVPDNVSSPNERSVVSREHYLKFAPDHRYNEFIALQGHAAARNRRAAFRDPAPDRPSDYHFAELMDPRLFFAFSPGQTFWEFCSDVADTLSGERGTEAKRDFEKSTHFYTASSGGETWYRTDYEFTQAEEGVFFGSYVWSPLAGFNPVTYSVVWKKDDPQRLTSMQWQYSQIDGIYVPVFVAEATYGGVHRESFVH